MTNNTVIFIVSGKITKQQDKNINLYVGSSYEKLSTYLNFSEESNIIIEIWENGNHLRTIKKGEPLF